MLDPLPRETIERQDRERDRELVLKYDPFGDREIALKLTIHDTVNPFDLLDNIGKELRNGTLSPFDFDHFGFKKHHQQLFVFGIRGRNSTRKEAFILWRSSRGYMIKERNHPTIVKARKRNSPQSFILDRQERENVLPLNTIEDFVSFLSEKFFHTKRKLEYIGSFFRETYSIACCNIFSKHRFALVSDRCIHDKLGRNLQQLGIEYIWKRERSERPFTKEEIYADICQFAGLLMEIYNKEVMVLALSRLTTFEWITNPHHK